MASIICISKSSCTLPPPDHHLKKITYLNNNSSHSILLSLSSPRFQSVRFSHNRLVSPSFASRSTGMETSETSKDTASLLDRVQVFDLDGKSMAISDLWKERKAVVAFARHFGCVLCRKRADYLAAKKELMDAAGVALVLIGPGSVDQARAFSEQTKFAGEVYADPYYSSYQALRSLRGNNYIYSWVRFEDHTCIYGRLPTRLGTFL